MKQKTAMQTLIDELKDYKRTTHADKLVIIFWITMAEKLLEKEKEQIIKANRDGVDMTISDKFITGEQYYNGTYKQD